MKNSLNSVSTCLKAVDTRRYGTNATLLAEAQAAVNNNFTVGGWQILTPVAGQRGQEFIIVSPEPAPVVLLIAGIAPVAILARFSKPRLA